MWRLLLCIHSWLASGRRFGRTPPAPAIGARLSARGRANRSCQFANSPRHDEHVIYEIAEDNGAAGKLKIEGYKIVNSAKQWMGTLLCNYRSADHVLTCAPKEGKPRDWTFQIKDGAMSETLVLPEDRTLHRKMSLQRIRKSA